MNQVYSYPFAIYGTNNHVGQSSNGVRVTSGVDDSMGTYSNARSKGVPLADSATNSNVTGAAANMPTLGSDIMDMIEGDYANQHNSRQTAEYLRTEFVMHLNIEQSQDE